VKRRRQSLQTAIPRQILGTREKKIALSDALGVALPKYSMKLRITAGGEQ
jgi:hypothetical protein